MRLCYNIQYPHKGTSVYSMTPWEPNIIIFLFFFFFLKGRGRVGGGMKVVSEYMYIYRRVYWYFFFFLSERFHCACLFMCLCPYCVLRSIYTYIFFSLRLNVISEELGRGSHVSEIVLKAFWQEIRASAIIIPWSLVPPPKPQPRSPRRNESLTCNEAPGCSSVHYHVNRRWENAKYVDYTYVGGFGERCIFAFFIYFFVFVFFDALTVCNMCL